MLFLLITALFVCYPGAQANNSSEFQRKIDKLEALSRVTNGIFIQSSVPERNSSILIAELLKIDSTDSLTGLESFEAESLTTQLETVRKSAATAQTQFSKSLKSELSLVAKMRENGEVLTEVKQRNTCDEYIEWMKIQRVVNHHSGIVECFKYGTAFIEGVDIILVENSSQQYGVNDLSRLNDILSKVRAAAEMMPYMFKDSRERIAVNFFLNMTTTGLNEGVRKMMRVAVVVEEYMENFGKLTALQTELGKMSADVKSVLPIAKESGRMEELSGALKSISESVERMNGPMGARELTVGLPGGTSDLEEIFKDLDGKWMKETIAGGKDLGKLKKLLEPLKTFTEGVKKVEGSWRNVSGHPGIQKALDLSADLHMTSESGKLVGSADPTIAMQAVANCLGSLKPITSSPNFTDIKVFHNGVMDIEKKVKSALPLLKKLSEGEITGNENHTVPESFFEMLSLSVKTNMIEDDVIAAIKLIQQANTTTPLYNAIKEYQVLKDYDDVVDTYLSFEEKSRGDDIRDALIESNMVETVDCLQKTRLNMDQVEAVWKLGDSAEMIKNKLGDTKDVVEFLKSVMDMKKTLGEVSGVGKKTLRRRRRASGGLEDLKNSKQLSIDLGRGVMALKKLEDVRKHQKTVLEVASCGDKVDNLIRTLPQVSALWTTDNKNGLTDMIKGLNDLDKKCSSLPPYDLLNLSSVFDLATDIRSVPIPSQLFSDPIATSLRSSSDPELQKSADSFQSVSALQLDFANQLSDLRAASGTMSSLRSFFDNFFGIVRKKSPAPTGSGSQTSTTIPSSPFNFIFIIIPIILLFLIAGGFGIWYYFQRNDPLFWKRLFMDKKKFAELIILNSRYLDFQEESFMKKHPKLEAITDAVEPNDLETVSLLVKHGFWINAEKESDTLLHLATCYGKFEIAELLIMNGADRTALNFMYKTPEEMVTVALNALQEKSNKNDEHREKMKNIEKIRDLFVATKDMTFLRKIPPLLKPKQFLIFIADNCDKVKFEKSFANQVTSELKVATHIVVKTDKDGVYEPDDNHLENMFMIFSRSMLMKECWLEESVKKKSNMQDDYKFQVEKIRFKEQVYSSVKDWHTSFHMKKVPYLTRVQAVCMSKPDWRLTAVLKRLGADVHEQIPELKTFNYKTAHPYHLFKHKLLWAIYPTDDKPWFRDQGNYLLLSIEELFVILLKRQFEYDPKKEPMMEVMALEGEEDAK